MTGVGGGMQLRLHSQTCGTQDKRGQSKGDVEVMKTKELRGRGAFKSHRNTEHFRPAPSVFGGSSD